MKLPKSGKIAESLNENMREAFMIKDLKHENIIEFEDAFVSNENDVCLDYNIVTELAEGGTLFTKNCIEPLEHAELQKAVW